MKASRSQLQHSTLVAALTTSQLKSLQLPGTILTLAGNKDPDAPGVNASNIC